MINPAITAIVIAVLAALAFGGGFALADWRSALQIQRSELACESQVTKVPSYGARNIKSGSVMQLNKEKEYSERLVRILNQENFVDQTPAEYELVEIFYK